MKILKNNLTEDLKSEVIGEYINIDDERYYVIRNVDEMEPFFISVVSNSDHWLFISSTGGLAAGRVSSETALFPYIPVDRVHESYYHTGSKTLLRIYQSEDSAILWEPFRLNHHFHKECNLYKNTLGNKIRFEEINHDLNMTFRYTWNNSEKYGFVRSCELEYNGEKPIKVEILDGLQNILPPEIESQLQNSASNLIDAYKWNEFDEKSKLAMYSLYSGITDRPQPHESLSANTIFCLGLENEKILLSSRQIKSFRRGFPLFQENEVRGRRGAFLINSTFELNSNDIKKWQIIAEVEQTQAKVVDLRDTLLKNREALALDIKLSIDEGSDKLASIMGSVDAFQATAEENVSVHHYANVLYNSMRGGIFIDQYRVQKEDFLNTIFHFNKDLFLNQKSFLEELPDIINYSKLIELVNNQNDNQLYRLAIEYLPLTFGRRHGDPSRPWNKFAIYLNDKDGKAILNYQGNWRDIFQNWEALTFSYPEFIESTVAKFVNASTIDGYNPYRIEKNGIDWEVEDLDDPWSYIGYWGDHQIIYLLKLLEQSKMFNPKRIQKLLYKNIFCYANVPYRIKPIDDIFENPKDTIVYDEEVALDIEKLVEEKGADGKLVLDKDGNVYQVNLLEKLLIPLLSKLSNLVIGGGIWMNTQRPEWNDANNALVGQGISMVTLYYLRRYIVFMNELLKSEEESFYLSIEVKHWLQDTSEVIKTSVSYINANEIDNKKRFEVLNTLGQVATTYREAVYIQKGFSRTVKTDISTVKSLLNDAVVVIDNSISSAKTDENLYHAYNLLDIENKELKVNTLYTMLEGQVAALSSGALSATQAVKTLEALFNSSLLREDLQTFLLYPDRQGIRFLEKNCIENSDVKEIAILEEMLALGDESIVLKDSMGQIRFNPTLFNKEALVKCIDMLSVSYTDKLKSDSSKIYNLFEKVYNHQEFTGRSGGMFGFEGLGCTYWHMVSKLLLAVQESYFSSFKENNSIVSEELKEYYYRVREGLGFNKTPVIFGAFPTDPYSHTPSHSGAKQPGMTGSVKEEILTRFGELGVLVEHGVVNFKPKLLRQKEFLKKPSVFEYFNVFGKKQIINLSSSMLAFTWCQVPIVYQLKEEMESICIYYSNGIEEVINGNKLSLQISEDIFKRNGNIEKIIYIIPNDLIS